MRSTRAASTLHRANKLVAVLRHREYRRAMRFGVAASVEHQAIPLRSDFETVIDVGANRGQFAVFARQRFPNAALICFEPLPEERARLRRAVGGGTKVELSEFALGARNATGEFHVASAADSSSLLPIGSRQVAAFPDTKERRTMAVEIRRLDDVIDRHTLARPVLLKIDVQGGELGVLQGGQQTLEMIDAVLVEVSFVELYTGQALADDVFDYLRDYDFSCVGTWSVTYGRRGECLQADFLFARAGFDSLHA